MAEIHVDAYMPVVSPARGATVATHARTKPHARSNHEVSLWCLGAAYARTF